VTPALLALPALPLVAAALLPAAGRLGARGLAWASGAVAAATLAVTLALAGPILAGGALTASVPWAPATGIALSFLCDGLSLLFVLLIVGIGLLVIVYARYYLAPDEALPRFYASLMLFMAAMVGVVTAGNLLLLVVFWELTSIASFLLIGFWDHEAGARSGAYQSLIVTGIGGLALLAGALVLGGATGTFEIADLTARAAEVRALPVASIALALILLGAFTKSAQVPFHFWLPSAMAAPTPVSAYLHSATMVKAGIFLLARLWPIFAPTALWYYLVTGFGAATMLVGGWAALRHTDLKRLLAYSTVSQLGLITMLYGIGTRAAAVAATFHIMNHAAFKASLFMTAGIVDHETGSRDLARLGGLRRALPRMAALAAIAAAAMAGVPPLNGFLSKEMFYEATLHGTGGGRPWLLPLLAVTGSTLTMAYCLRFVVGAFCGPAGDYPKHHPHEPPAGMRAPVEILVAVCVAVGLAPRLLTAPLLDGAASAVVGTPAHAHLALWHGLTPALALSLVGLAAGAALYVGRRATARTALPPRLGLTAGEIYDQVVHGIVDGARKLTDGYQTGRLRLYVSVFLGFLILLAGRGALQPSAAPTLLPATPSPPGAVPVTLLTCGAALSVCALYRQRWPSILALAVVGAMVAIYFAWLSAPDLLLTQLLVEAVSTILVVLVLYFLPKRTRSREPRPRLALDATIALAVGVAATAVIYAVLRRPFSSISSYHVANSLALAGGRNVVNVILVDFRGYDTLGEITVLAIAAVGVLALVQAGRRPS
jgi:multicomponent K+:H+ antiporter subunit A